MASGRHTFSFSKLYSASCTFPDFAEVLWFDGPGFRVTVFDDLHLEPIFLSVPSGAYCWNYQDSENNFRRHARTSHKIHISQNCWTRLTSLISMQLWELNQYFLDLRRCWSPQSHLHFVWIVALGSRMFYIFTHASGALLWRWPRLEYVSCIIIVNERSNNVIPW